MAVFAGEALSIKTENKEELVEFKVERFWKGPQAKRLFIVTEIESNHRYKFTIGEKYLVYAYGSRLSTNKCSRTKVLSSASDDLKELGEGKKP